MYSIGFVFTTQYKHELFIQRGLYALKMYKHEERIQRSLFALNNVSTGYVLREVHLSRLTRAPHSEELVYTTTSTSYVLKGVSILLTM